MTALNVTMITILYAAAQFFAAPVLGQTWGTLRTAACILVSIAGSVVGYLTLGWWRIMGCLSRLSTWLSGGNLLQLRLIADVPNRRIGKNLPSLDGMGCCLILGPALGGLFSQISWMHPFSGCWVISRGAVLVFFLLPNSLPQETRETVLFAHETSIRSFPSQRWRQTPSWFEFFGHFLFNFVSMGLTYTGRFVLTNLPQTLANQ